MGWAANQQRMMRMTDNIIDFTKYSNSTTNQSELAAKHEYNKHRARINAENINSELSSFLALQTFKTMNEHGIDFTQDVDNIYPMVMLIDVMKSLTTKVSSTAGDKTADPYLDLAMRTYNIPEENKQPAIENLLMGMETLYDETEEGDD